MPTIESAPLPARQLITLVQVAKFLNRDITTIRRWISEIPGFPQPARINGRPYFVAGEISNWLEARLRERGERDAV